METVDLSSLFPDPEYQQTGAGPKAGHKAVPGPKVGPKVPGPNPEVIAVMAPASETTAVLAKTVYRKRKTMTELNVTQPLDGPVSLQFLERGGFFAVETVRFPPGTITELRDIPASVRRIVAPHNRITSIDLFPEGAEHVDLENNQVGPAVDLARLRSIQHLNLAGNQVEVIEPFPPSLVHLNLARNRVRELQLDGAPTLQFLDVSDNPSEIVVQSLPDTVVDARLPANARTVQPPPTSTSTEEKEDNVQPLPSEAHRDALRQFFARRSEYQHQLASLQRRRVVAARRVPGTSSTGADRGETVALPPCTGCNRPVGMQFLTRNQKYIVACGSVTSPCSLRETVYRGEYHPVRQVMGEMRDTVRQTRDHIIRQKMDTLFEYISEDRSADLFKRHAAFYRTSTDLARKYTKAYEAANFNEAKAELITRKQAQIQRLVMAVGQHIDAGRFAEAARIQSEEIAPIAQYIHTLRFEKTEWQPFEERGVRMVPYPADLARTEINVGIQ